MTGRSRWSTFILLSPWIVTFIAFSLYPVGYSLYLSFTKYDPLAGISPQFIGLSNYVEIMNDPTFWQAVKNTVIFVVGTIPVTTAIAIILAVFLNQKIKFRSFFRASYFVPVMTSVVVISTIFTYIYSPYGLLNSLLNLFGIPGKNWLLSTNFALPAIMVMMIWASFGYYTVLFLAGLQNIPEEIYESAAIDGANTVQTFFRITLPLLRPMLIFALVINTIRSFQVFSQIFVMTQGGPLGSTRTIVYYLYNMGFQKFRMGYASGIAYLLFILILVFSVIQMKSLSYEEQFYD
ncbi:sugar ABC transporter permease [Candidatus Bipolaricaulota bacterium]|nr:sugar ABC transporter permease [Candidatus Bipolaricaulota bacterium]